MADILCEDILNSKFFTEILIHHVEKNSYIYRLKENPHIKWLYHWKEPENDRIKLTKAKSDFLKRFNNQFELDMGTCPESSRFWREGQCCFLESWESQA